MYSTEVNIRNISLFIAFLLCAGCRHVAIQSHESNSSATSTYLAPLKVELQKCWPTNRTVNIVCHGHSVPAGYFKTPKVQTFDAYPSIFHKRLSDQYPHAVITIDYALNDRGLGLARAEKAWRAMIEQAQTAGIKVILLTPTPDKSSHLDDPNDPLHQHARQIRNLAQEYHVALVDSLAAFNAKIHSGVPLNKLMSQINHPNRQGHELVADALMKWFR